MSSPTARRVTPSLGLHVADDAVRVARVSIDERGRPRLDAWWSFELPTGVVSAGLVRQAGQLPAEVTDGLRRATGGAAVRVALASADVACVPLGQGTDDPVAQLVRRLPPGELGDALWADVISLAGRPVGLAGARRSVILRTRDALARAGVRTAAVEPMPAALAAVVLGLLDVPVTAWTVHWAAGGAEWRITAGRGGRLEAGAVPSTNVTPRLTLQVQAPGTPTTVDAIDRIRSRFGRAASDVPDRAVPSLTLAVGAALGGLGGLVGSPDLASAVIVRPLGPADALPRWAVEAMDAATVAPPPRARRARRGAR